MMFIFVMMFFFFKRKTAYEMRISDWSSDVCSSDLLSHRGPLGAPYELDQHVRCHPGLGDRRGELVGNPDVGLAGVRMRRARRDDLAAMSLELDARKVRHAVHR